MMRDFPGYLRALQSSLHNSLASLLQGEDVKAEEVAVVPVCSGMSVREFALLRGVAITKEDTTDMREDKLQGRVTEIVQHACQKLGVRWTTDPCAKDGVLVCNVDQFLGMERSVVVVVIWPGQVRQASGPESSTVHFTPRQEREFYCAISRAQSHLIIVGDEPGIQSAKQGAHPDLGREFVSAVRSWPDAHTLVAICERGLHTQPGEDVERELYYWLARGHQALGQRDAAVESISKCLSPALCNKQAYSLLHVGMKHAANRRWQEATASFRELVKDRFTNPGFSNEGRRASQFGDNSALTDWQRRAILSLQVESAGLWPVAQFLLGAALAELGQPEEACEHIAGAGKEWLKEKEGEVGEEEGKKVRETWPNLVYYNEPEVGPGAGDSAMSMVKEFFNAEKQQEFLRDIYDPEFSSEFLELLPKLEVVDRSQPDYHEHWFGRSRQCLRAIWEIDAQSPYFRELDDALMLARVIARLRNGHVSEEKVQDTFAKFGWWGVATHLLVNGEWEAVDCLEVGNPVEDPVHKLRCWEPSQPPRWLLETGLSSLSEDVVEDLKTFALNEYLDGWRSEVESAREPLEARQRDADVTELQRVQHFLRLAGVQRAELDEFPVHFPE